MLLDTRDNVATLIDPGKKGEKVEVTSEGGIQVSLAADVPYGHKCAIKPIAQGAEILKYGQVIGRATTAIKLGEHVHVHNVEALRARGDIKESK
ncbi:MAG TPA: UxaA family hydrolase [Hyphomicrobiaceae bacterium]|nr:UxaA family hydrolase [Hyphomicrobiaceae bacterium]